MADPHLTHIETAYPDVYDALKENARANRLRPTQAEEALWQQLRCKRQGVRFRRQHAIGDYIADFVCIEKRLIIEVDGKYHDIPEQQQEDAVRTAFLQERGYTIIRFTNEEVFADPEHVAEQIKLFIQQ